MGFHFPAPHAKRRTAVHVGFFCGGIMSALSLLASGPVSGRIARPLLQHGFVNGHYVNIGRRARELAELVECMENMELENVVCTGDHNSSNSINPSSVRVWYDTEDYGRFYLSTTTCSLRSELMELKARL